MKKEQITVGVELSYDPKIEDRMGSLAATFIAIGEGIANGRTAGSLPNKGTWELRSGAHILK